MKELKHQQYWKNYPLTLSKCKSLGSEARINGEKIVDFTVCFGFFFWLRCCDNMLICEIKQNF